MRILVANDDGIYSPGIAALAEVASKFGVSRADIIKWNPDVSKTLDGTFYDCINFWPQQQICVGKR